jgi:hypothetical protein
VSVDRFSSSSFYFTKLVPPQITYFSSNHVQKCTVCWMELYVWRVT